MAPPPVNAPRPNHDTPTQPTGRPRSLPAVGSAPVRAPQDNTGAYRLLERRFVEPGLINGRPATVWLHVVALALAAGADLAAFYQVVAITMPELGSWLLWLIVVGFAATALYLTHITGELLRDYTASRLLGKLLLAMVCVLGWLALGGVAFYVRLHGGESVANVGTVSIGSGVDQAPATDPHVVPKAVLFAVFYVATGVVALVGSYVTRNPALSRYQRGLRAHAVATEDAALTSAAFAAADEALQRYINDLERNDRMLTDELAAREAFAAQLKELAREVMAAHKQDAPTTDGLFPPPHQLHPPRHDTHQPPPEIRPGGPDREAHR